MRMIIVGGPGRSGTTYVANRIGTHLQCAHFFDIELKILSEIDGLSDLRHVLCDHYSPPRAEIAVMRFATIFEELRIGTFGQPLLSGGIIDEMRDAALNKFIERFRKGKGVSRVSYSYYNMAARQLIMDLGMIAAHGKPTAECFVEKTPHNSLNLGFIHELFPHMDFLHIFRDPRAIALSLLQQVWGPNTLEDAIQWVISYFDSWRINRDLALQRGVRMMEVKIEDLVSDPVSHSSMIQDFVRVEKNEYIFFDSSAAMVNGWLQRLGPETLNTLNDSFGSLISDLGYSMLPTPVLDVAR